MGSKWVVEVLPFGPRDDDGMQVPILNSILTSWTNGFGCEADQTRAAERVHKNLTTKGWPVGTLRRGHERISESELSAPEEIQSFKSTMQQEATT